MLPSPDTYWMLTHLVITHTKICNIYFWLLQQFIYRHQLSNINSKLSNYLILNSHSFSFNYIRLVNRSWRRRGILAALYLCSMLGPTFPTWRPLTAWKWRWTGGGSLPPGRVTCCTLTINMKIGCRMRCHLIFI